MLTLTLALPLTLTLTPYQVSWDGAGVRWHAASLDGLVAHDARWDLAWG